MILFSLAPAPAFALQFFDDFSTGSPSWVPGPGWSVTNLATNAFLYRCDCTSNSMTWRNYTPVGSSWQYQADFYFRNLYGNSGTTSTASLALGQSNDSVTILINLTQTSGKVLIEAQYYTGSWTDILNSDWIPSPATAYHVSVILPSGSNFLQCTVTTTNGFSYNSATAAIPASVLGTATVPGFRVFSGVVDMANVQITTPLVPQSLHYETQASNAVNDIIGHFWTGDALTGQIVNTHGGYTTNLPDARGVLWERGTFYLTLDDLYLLTGDPTLQQRLQADWTRTRSVYTQSQLQNCGQGSQNVAVDDSGWTSIMYLDAYEATGDPLALTVASNLVNNAFNRWLDTQLGGGMWYSDARQIKSVYQVAIVLSALRIYELTGNQSYYDRATKCYNWMQTYLLRDDGLYWCDYNSSGPVGTNDPDQIAETSSVVYLGGDMGMALLNARLYQLTGDTNYLGRAIRTANGIFNLEATTAGVYIDDRDAWTESVFAGDWAREVLTLPGIDPKHWSLLWTTADSIYTNARTSDGYYGGSWSGPAEGPGSAWWSNGSDAVMPQQITCSATAVNMIVAAGVLQGQYAGIICPTVRISTQPSRQVAISASGQPLWPYQFQSSVDLTNWQAVTNFYTGPSAPAFTFTSSALAPRLFFSGVPLVQP
jgi:predicted alpha-1,6-mannanase (GH76 family)